MGREDGAGGASADVVSAGQVYARMRSSSAAACYPFARLICTSRSFANRRPVGVAASPPPAGSVEEVTEKP